jgi:thiosulfate reductase cytochrome b subunit
LALALLLSAVFFTTTPILRAQENGAEGSLLTRRSTIHPPFPLLDETGTHVLESNRPISTMQTCGTCHDTAFIAQHSAHSDLGLAQWGQPGSYPWSGGPGTFGDWSPLRYRSLAVQGDGQGDLTTADWVQQFGARHVGGGPAMFSRSGVLLSTLPPSADHVETSITDPATGQRLPWDWAESGVVEMNCFLCHTANPDNAARIAALQAGDFGWANTATLLGSGIVARTADGYAWNPAAFDANGLLLPQHIGIQDPTHANCGQCHGMTNTDNATPLLLAPYSQGDWTTLTTGQIMATDRISRSGLNLADKNSLTRSWDIHTERVLNCVNCHYSLNNPVYFQGSADKQPDHLTFDPRRLDLGSYLHRPLHRFAQGQSAQSALTTAFDNTIRRCESCHSVENNHTWLPYRAAHMAAVTCESCHIPQLYAPALQYVDWTVIQPDGEPVRAWRGSADNPLTPTSFVEGYTPILLPRKEQDGSLRLAPFNLVSAWYWVYGDPPRPVPQSALQDVWFDGATGRYHADVLAAFDSDGDGVLSKSAELLIDSDAKAAVIAQRLAAAGFPAATIQGEVQPFGIHHNVTTGTFATQDCQACHSATSLAATPLPLADRTPGGVLPTLPTLRGAELVQWAGVITPDGQGGLAFVPKSADAGYYLFGHHASRLIDWLGGLMLLGVIGGAATHGGLRWWAARRHNQRHGTPHATETRPVYMYDVYERFWHWLQTATIFILLFTGLVIHKPDTFGIFSFAWMVQVHNIVAVILVLNAALSLFYHLVSGDIRQYLPRPRGLFDEMFAQGRYYLGGIFRGEPHPFEKSRDRKLNPLQQLTYFAILNVLLPLQIITGILMWGAQRWPEWAGRFGGLPLLAPFHSLIAWSFAAFIVMHVYLTTTGHEPLANIRAMMFGWDEVETPTDPEP